MVHTLARINVDGIGIRIKGGWRTTHAIAYRWAGLPLYLVEDTQRRNLLEPLPHNRPCSLHILLEEGWENLALVRVLTGGGPRLHERFPSDV